MSSFGHKEREILEKAARGKYVEEQRKKQRMARLKKGAVGIRIPDRKPKPEGHHEKRMKSLAKQLRTGIYEKPEFADSIPDESSTVAPMIRGGFQSPPTTPPKRKLPGLVRTTTPVIVPRAPKLQFSEKFEPRTRVKGERRHPNVTTRRRHKKKIEEAARAKAKKPEQLLEISDSDTDQGDEKAVDNPDWWDPEEESSEHETTSSSEWDPRQYALDTQRRRLGQKMYLRYHTEPKVKAIKRPTTNIAGLRALRAKQKKDRQAQKQRRVNSRHNLGTHHPVVPKLQINNSVKSQLAGFS